MLLVLALRGEPRRVYERALRDLHAEFIRLLPSAPRPISIQRFSPRRIGLTLVVLTGAFLAVGLVVSDLGGLGLTPG